MTRREELEASPLIPEIVMAFAALSSSDWDAATRWADVCKQMMPDMESARWQGIRHGFAGGLAYNAALRALAQEQPA